jgi:hypothetical protein
MRCSARFGTIWLVSAVLVASLTIVCAAGAAEALASTVAEPQPCSAPVAAFAQAPSSSPDSPPAALVVSDPPRRPIPRESLAETPRPSAIAAAAITPSVPRSPPASN